MKYKLIHYIPDNMKKIRFFLVAILTMVSCVLAAQNLVTVSGTVTENPGGIPVPFASILQKGTLTGTTTDLDGNYSLSVPDNAVLVFSSIGYKSVEVNVAGQKTINVVLEVDNEMIEETIVVAFGKTTKEAFTGSATVVKSEDIAKVQSSDATRALEGHVAGVQMTTTSGALGSSPSIIIRGVSSINAGSSPLYVIDGIPYDGDMNNINSSDIESMTVLKDAASNALYGARGANGVIMITTKKAKTGDAVVNVDAKWGLNTKALKNYDYITDPGQYYEAHYASLYNYYRNNGYSDNEAYQRANRSLCATSLDTNYPGGLGYNVYTVPQGQNLIGTNGKLNPAATLGRMITWQGEDYWVQPDSYMDEAYINSLRQEYNVSVSGTTGKANIFVSFGYLNNKGITEGSDMYRYSARLKTDYQAKSWLKIGANASYTNFNWNNGNSDEGSSASTGNIFAFASQMAPIYPVYIRDVAGNIRYDSHGYRMYDYGNGGNAGLERSFNPNSNALQAVTLDVNNSEGNAFNGTAYAEITFLKDFTFTFNAGAGVDETRGTSMSNMYYGQYESAGGIVSKSHSRTFYINLQQLLNYDHTFNFKHHVSALLGHENYRNTGAGLSAMKSMMFSIDNLELSGAILDSQKASSSRSTYNNEGYFSRVMYDYANKLFFSASYRLDASSRFHPKHRWGSFWSIGGGWVINDEPWFNVRWMDMLKLKASIGSQGNDNIGSYLYTDQYYITNNDGQIGVIFTTKGNEKITWETNTNFNAGVDYSFLNGRFKGSLEYFYRNTTDMLFWFTVPPTNGFSGYYANVGDMRNAGLEFDVNANIYNRKNFRWDAYFNFTHYTNKITHLPDQYKTNNIEGYDGYINGSYYRGEGLPLYTFYMQKYAGVDKEDGLPMWYKDVLDENGNVTGRETTKKYAEATKYLCGNSTPKLYGGFGTSLEFFGVDISVNFTYSIGGLAYDSGYASLVSPSTGIAGTNYHKDVLNAWTPENRDSDFPRFYYGDTTTASQSDRFLTDASYLNFQNAQIGYTFPSKFLQKLHVSRLRVYATCDNICYFSARSGFDPRQSMTGATSNALNSPVRTISGGLNITF